MVNFTVKLADIIININSLFDSSRSFCRDYLCEGTPDFEIIVNEDDIAFERERSLETNDIHFSDQYLETLAIYRKIAEIMPEYDTLLFHGSAVSMDGEGYLFTAKSGTGKSTHTRIWREVFPGRAVMVNDDKPLIKISGEGAVVYGTPWDGKHRLSNNISVPLKAVCFLQRDSVNHIESVDKDFAWTFLLSQSYRPFDPIKMIKTLELLDRLTKNVGLYRLGCNMDKSAAEVSYNGMNRR